MWAEHHGGLELEKAVRAEMAEGKAVGRRKQRSSHSHQAEWSEREYSVYKLYSCLQQGVFGA